MGALKTLSVVMALALLASPTLSAPRSPAVKAEFRKANPCPATGRVRGACPGWHVDHVQALVCGGRDEVGNLQWLTVEAHKAKTKREVRECRRRRPARTN